MGNAKSKQSAVIVPSPAPATEAAAEPVTPAIIKEPTLEERNTESIAMLPFGTNEQRDLYRILKERWFRVMPVLEKGLVEFYDKGWPLYSVESQFSVGSDKHRCFHYRTRAFPDRGFPRITTFAESQDQISKTLKAVQDSDELYYVLEIACTPEYSMYGSDKRPFSIERRLDKAGLIKFYEELLPKTHLMKALEELPLCKDVNGIIADYAA